MRGWSYADCENDVLRYQNKILKAVIREIEAALKGHRGELATAIRRIIKDYREGM